MVLNPEVLTRLFVGGTSGWIMWWLTLATCDELGMSVANCLQSKCTWHIIKIKININKNIINTKLSHGHTYTALQSISSSTKHLQFYTLNSFMHSEYYGSCSIPTSFSSKAREVGNEPRSLLCVLNICWPYFIHQTWLLIESHSKHNVTCEETRHQEMADSLQK